LTNDKEASGVGIIILDILFQDGQIVGIRAMGRADGRTLCFLACKPLKESLLKGVRKKKEKGKNEREGKVNEAARAVLETLTSSTPFMWAFKKDLHCPKASGWLKIFSILSF